MTRPTGLREPMLRLGILLSGSGRTLQNLIDRIQAETLHAQIVCVLSSQPDVPGIDRAQAARLPTFVVPRRTAPDPEFHDRIHRHLEDAGADLVCMAGFTCLWRIPSRYDRRVLNIHPALLPRFGGKGFYGLAVHRAVLAAGERESGCTVHYCDNEYDHGPIILQRRVPVLDGDTPETLAARVFAEECLAYPEAIVRVGGEVPNDGG